MRVQATLNPNLNDGGMSELWEGLTVNDDVDPTLDLPMNDSRMGGMTIEPPPTLYSTAIDSSLRGLQAAGGWRMFVPEEDENLLENLLVDTMNVDNQLAANPNSFNEDWVAMEEELGPRDGWQNAGVLLIEGQAGDQQEAERGILTMEKAVEAKNAQKSQYKALALQDLALGFSGGEEGMEEDKADEKERMNRGFVGGRGGTSVHGELLSEIDRVMLRVEEAMNNMEGSEGNKRVRRFLETSATEVRSMVKQVEEGQAGDTVEGARTEEGKVILLVASEFSGESGEKKRKRRAAGKAKVEGVASRLRKKTPTGLHEEYTKAEQPKTARMVVRKVKVSNKRPSTSLTLEPPTLGLANE